MRRELPSRCRALTYLTAALVVCVIHTGCATLFGSRSDWVEVASEPDGATVSVDGQVAATTPGAVRVDKKRTHTVRFEKDGYAPLQVVTKRRPSNWFWAQLGAAALLGWANADMQGSKEGWAVFLVYGAIPLGIDLGTGKALVQRPGRIEATLVPVGREGDARKGRSDLDGPRDAALPKERTFQEVLR